MVVYDEPVAKGEKRRQRMKSGFDTRKEAEEWFDRKREQLERGFTASTKGLPLHATSRIG